MNSFTPCRGKTACRDDGNICLVCGRRLQEIEATRRLIDALADLAVQYQYDNADDFAAYVASKLAKKIRHRQQAGGVTEG